MAFDQKRIDHFMSKVDVTDTCWLWMAGRSSDGYGAFWTGETMTRAHQFAYRAFVGEIPMGLQLDHLCRVRHCVNPAHLEPVTQRENILRGEGMAAQRAKKTHCPKGHPYSGDNLFITRIGSRQCRTCMRDSSRANQRRRRARLKTA